MDNLYLSEMLKSTAFVLICWKPSWAHPC